MKRLTILMTILFVASLLSGCSAVSQLIQKASDIEVITPSNNIIDESRQVSGFTGIDMRTFGRIILTQGDSESLTIQGPDNIVPLIRTTVSNGTLIIENSKNFNVLNMGDHTVLTLTIMVKDLSKLTVSGAGLIEMNGLSTSSFELDMSGAGEVKISQFAAEQLDVTVSGAGSIKIEGQVTQASIDIPGAGSVNGSDLKCQTATVNISGLGGATLWVTDQLSGTISGAGSVSYYGNPELKTTTTGLGTFNDLGDK